MGELWEKGLLVKLKIKGQKVGGGIVINQNGFILTANHNVHDIGEFIIEEVFPSLNGNWEKPIPNPQETNNMVSIAPDFRLAKELDLVLIKVEGNYFRNAPPLQICDEPPKEKDPVILLFYDPTNKNGNYWREEDAIIDKFQYYQLKDGSSYPEVSICKVNGIHGASGGGVFTKEGKLLGIIKERRTDGIGDYIATWVGEKRITQWIPNYLRQTELKQSTTNLLNGGREIRKSSKKPPLQPSIPRKKLNPSLIAEHDLDEFIGIFRANISFKGIFAFSINGTGKKDILKKYIIKRIHEVLLKERGRKSVEPIEVSIFPGDIVDLNNKIKTRFNQGLENKPLLESIDDINRLLVIWNHNIPISNLKQTIRDFYKEIHHELSVKLNDDFSSFCFVIIWANLSPSENLTPEEGDIFFNLALPNKFDVQKLWNWFCNKLKNHFQKEEINCHYDELTAAQGEFEETYYALESIFNRL